MHTLVTRKPRTPEKSRVRGSSVFISPQKGSARHFVNRSVIPWYSCRGSHPPGPADNLYDSTCVFLGQSAFFLHILLEKLHTYEIGQHTFQNAFVSFSFENYTPNTFSRPENSTKNFERGIRIADTTLNRHFSRCFSMMMVFTSAYFKLMSSKMLSSASEVHPSR